MSETAAEQTNEQAATDQGADAPAETSKKPTVKAALQAFLDAHATPRKLHISNAFGSTEVDDPIPCECGLCAQGRAAIGA